jgi:hypothetical protein
MDVRRNDFYEQGGSLRFWGVFKVSGDGVALTG